MGFIDFMAIAEVANSSGFTGMLVSFGPFILIIVVMYFLLFRSQQKKNKERQLMLNSMRAGDKVLTAGGIIGTIAAIKEKTMTIKIAENVKKNKIPLPMVILSARNNQEDINKAVKFGVKDYFIKPFSLEKLMHSSSKDSASRNDPREFKAIRLKAESSNFMPSFFEINSNFFIISGTCNFLKSNRWHLEVIVGIILCASVVAKIKIA